MNKFEELRKLAEMAKIMKHPHPNTLLWQADARAYKSAANPQTILDLLDLIEMQHAALESCINDGYNMEFDCDKQQEAISAYNKFKEQA